MGGIAPDGARGASILLVDVIYASSESERMLWLRRFARGDPALVDP